MLLLPPEKKEGGATLSKGEGVCGKMEIEMGIEMGIGMKWTIEFNQKIMDKIGFSIRKSTLFNVLLIQRLKKKSKSHWVYW